MIVHENRPLSDDSHEKSYLIFSKIGEDVSNLSSAAVVIGALRVNNEPVYQYPGREGYYILQ